MAHVIELTIGGNTKRSKFKPVPVKIDWDKLTDEAQAFVIRYGLRQYLADGGAGSETQDAWEADVKERVRKVMEADFTRAKGEGKPDSVESRALKLARAAVREAAKVEGGPMAAALASLVSAKKAEDTKAAIALVAKAKVAKEPKWKAEAEAQLKAEAEAKERLGEDETADILADLLSTEGEDEDADESEEEDETNE